MKLLRGSTRHRGNASLSPLFTLSSVQLPRRRRTRFRGTTSQRSSKGFQLPDMYRVSASCQYSRSERCNIFVTVFTDSNRGKCLKFIAVLSRMPGFLYVSKTLT
jgi:hypothetical protein